MKRHSIGRDAAIALAESRWWEGKTAREICEFQLFTTELCMDFGDFHKALEESLGRPVWTHELGVGYDGIVAEFLGEKPPPTIQQIIEMIPAEKRIVIQV